MNFKCKQCGIDRLGGESQAAAADMFGVYGLECRLHADTFRWYTVILFLFFVLLSQVSLSQYSRLLPETRRNNAAN